MNCKKCKRLGKPTGLFRISYSPVIGEYSVTLCGECAVNFLEHSKSFLEETSMDYDDYLKSQEWESQREERLNEEALQADLKNDEIKLEELKGMTVKEVYKYFEERGRNIYKIMGDSTEGITKIVWV